MIHQMKNQTVYIMPFFILFEVRDDGRGKVVIVFEGVKPYYERSSVGVALL